MESFIIKYLIFYYKICIQAITKININTKKMNPQPEESIHETISLDRSTLAQKTQLLKQYYEQNSDQSRLEVIKRWPNQAISSCESPHPTNNAMYFGNVSNELFHGPGLLIYNKPDCRYYEGEFQNSCKHGKGFEYINGDVYVGKYVNNKPEDENGVFMWGNGDVFRGGFVNGMKHGQGSWKSGNDWYEGMWKWNKPEGEGKIHTHLSDYDGLVKNGYKHGYGVEIFANGDRYEGQYANGKPEGDGKYFWANGAMYKGQFKNGMRFGYGQWTYGKEKYEGHYINDKRTGQGLYRWDHSNYYKGQFLDDMRHGQGEMHWAEGAYYRGQWRQGNQCGEGQLWQGGKLVKKGVFEDGKLVHQPRSPITRKQQKHSMRYPSIQPKHKAKSFHQPTLHPIHQTPKRYNPKNVTSTSFSHHTKLSKKSDVSQVHSYKPILQDKKHTRVPSIQTKQKPPKLSETKYHHNNRRQKIVEKKVKTRQVGIDMTQTQLGPIKWNNFRNMRSSDHYSNFPKI